MAAFNAVPERDDGNRDHWPVATQYQYQQPLPASVAVTLICPMPILIDATLSPSMPRFRAEQATTTESISSP